MLWWWIGEVELLGIFKTIFELWGDNGKVKESHVEIWWNCCRAVHIQFEKDPREYNEKEEVIC